MAIDTRDNSSPDKHFLTTIDEPKKKDIIANDPSNVEFDKLTYSDDDFYYDCFNDWVAEELQNIVQQFSLDF